LAARKSKWKDVEDKINDGSIEKWASDGLTERQIAKNLGIAMSTFSNYKNQYPVLVNTIKLGRQQVVKEVKGVLLKLALGEIETTESTEKICADGGIETTTKTKQYPPSLQAITLLLSNYDDEWHKADHQEIDSRERELKIKEEKHQNEDW
jgi:transposase